MLPSISSLNAELWNFVELVTIDPSKAWNQSSLSLG